MFLIDGTPSRITIFTKKYFGQYILVETSVWKIINVKPVYHGKYMTNRVLSIANYVSL